MAVEAMHSKIAESTFQIFNTEGTSEEKRRSRCLGISSTWPRNVQQTNHRICDGRDVHPFPHGACLELQCRLPTGGPLIVPRAPHDQPKLQQTRRSHICRHRPVGSSLLLVTQTFLPHTRIGRRRARPRSTLVTRPTRPTRPTRLPGAYSPTADRRITSLPTCPGIPTAPNRRPLCNHELGRRGRRHSCMLPISFPSFSPFSPFPGALLRSQSP